ncbi:MAG: ABC transporter permease [Lachnospiraceae bacterium]
MSTIIIDGLAFSLPLFVMAIGGIYSERSGITNLALEGLQGFGAFTGALVAVIAAQFVAGTSSIPFYLAIIFAMIGGMLFSVIHASLCIYFKADMVISGVVINILAMALTEFLTKQLNSSIFHAPSNKFVLGISGRVTVPILSKIPFIGSVFTNLYTFQFIIVIVAVIAWFVMYKTRFGLHLRACGNNPHAVDAAGIHVGRIRFIAVLVSGALSGLGGICFAYSVSASFSPSIYVGYGYLAIAAYIFGNWQIMPTLAACLLFGFARSAGYRIVQALAMPSSYQDLVMILPYLLTLLLLIFFSKKNRAPKALGVIYDKGAR